MMPASRAWRLPSSTLALPVVGALALVTIFIDPALVFILAVAALMAWLGWARPADGLGVVAVTIPVQDAFTIPIGAASLTMTRLVILPFLVGWSVAWLVGRARLPATAPIVSWALVVAALGVSIVSAVDRGAWSEEVYRWTVALGLYVVAVGALRRSEDARALMWGTVSGVLLSVSVALWQVATGTGPPTFEAGGLMRAYGWFGEPNPLAAYLEMTVLLLAPVGLLRVTRSGANLWSRFGLLAVTAAGGLVLLFTQSRGGLLGFAVGGLVIALALSRWTRALALVGIILAVPLLAMTPAGRSGVDRFASSLTAVTANEQVTPANWSVQERVAHWRAGLQMLESSPLTGVGAGNFDTRYREMTTVWRFRIPRGHAHHSAIQMGAQSGYTGLIAYLVLLFTAGARILRGVLNARFPIERAWTIGALGVLVAVIVHGQFDYLHGLSLNLAFALALACAEPAIRTCMRESDPDRATGATS
jgi:O-antigen ligase